MDKRISTFNAYFAKWEIALPPDIEGRHPRGSIQSRGWIIEFAFGEDEDGKLLDFYACHRMTNDRHVRVRSNGNTESLPAYPDALAPWNPEYVEMVDKVLKQKDFGVGANVDRPLLRLDELWKVNSNDINK